MDNLLQKIKIEEYHTSRTRLLLYLLFAYFFSVGARLFLYQYLSTNPDYFYNNHIVPIWTADAGLYGFYANQLLSDISYPFISEYVPGYLIYALVSITGLDVDTILFFSPAFIASLIVIPIILIANHYKIAKIGLYAALIGSIMTSYYYRTHLGYYDTDILNATLPLLAIYFIIRVIDSKALKYALFASVSLMIFSLWYHSSAPIIVSVILIFIIYTLLFERKSILLYQSILLLFVALVPLVFIYKVGVVLFLTFGVITLNRYKTFDYKIYLSIFFVAILAFFLLADTTKYYERVDNYINKNSSIEVSSKEGTIKFKSTLGSVLEAKSIDISQIVHRVSGTVPFFILALLGYIALLLRHRSMFITLPLVFLVFISMVAGLRFTIYGVMIFSFALVFGVHIILNIILVEFGEFSKKIANIATSSLTLLILLFSFYTMDDYNRTKLSPPLFASTQDMATLSKLKEKTTKDDFVISWWDYGWPLWYYTNLNTLIDNGKHQQDNYIVSKLLLSTNETFTKNASIFFTEEYKQGRKKGFSKVMDYFISKYPLSYLKELEKDDFILPKSDGDIYIALHKYMLFTLGTIESFSNLSLKTGRNYSSAVMNVGFLYGKYQQSQMRIETKDFRINLDKGHLHSKTGTVAVKKIVIVENNQIKFEKSYLTSDAATLLISDGMMLLIKPKLYNSFLVQTLVFNNYNSDYFEKVSQTDKFIILKVKQ